MRTLRLPRVPEALGAAALAIAAGACLDLDEPAIGTGEQELPAEMPGGVAEYVWRRYTTQPDVAMASYALPSFGGCNASMVGPNLLMTAAHCGANDSRTATFLTYRDGGAWADREDFACSYLLQTATDTDLVLYYCWPNAAGDNPGDKYGYLDLDTSMPSVGQTVYSVWGNQQVTGSVGYDERMYSTGTVTSTTAGDGECWAAHGTLADATITDTWGEGGVSGSPQIDTGTHQIVIGPTSTAWPDGARWRCALPMHEYLYWGNTAATMPAGWAPSRNSARIRSLGLNPAEYLGWIDDDLDFRFDIQTDLERRLGEGARGWYWLGFESPRRNALWDIVGSRTSIDPVNRWAHIVHDAGWTYQQKLVHARLNLPADGAWYRVSLMVYTNSASWGSTLFVGLYQGGAPVSGGFVPTAIAPGVEMDTLLLQAPTGGAPPELVLGTYGDTDLLVQAISVIRDGDVMDFDRHDERYNWRNDIDGSRAQVVPDGSVGGTPNWAVRVAYDPTDPAGWPVRNRQLAFVPGSKYRICVDARDQGSTVGGVLRVVSGGVERSRVTFAPGASWGRTCTTTFTTPSSDTNLQMGVAWGTASYLVDNLTIERW